MNTITIDLYRSGKWLNPWLAWSTLVYSQEEAEKTIDLCKEAPNACRIEVTYHPEEAHVILECMMGVWYEKEGN